MKLKKSHYSNVSIFTSLIILVSYAFTIQEANPIDTFILVLLVLNFVMSAFVAIPNKFFTKP